MTRIVFGVTLIGLVGGLLSADAAMLHEHEGPHKGIVVEWGDEEYHPELVVDPKTGTATVYVYGNEDSLKQAKAAPVAAKTLTLALKTTPPTTVKLTAAPEPTDPAGTASKFVGKHDGFTKSMKWAGTLSGRVGTKPYSGDFAQK